MQNTQAVTLYDVLVNDTLKITTTTPRGQWVNIICFSCLCIATSAWCPKIYFNHKCFSGPYLSKGRIAELPKSVGPGPIMLVMKEVLTMLINVAYKSSRVLRELQMEDKPNPNMFQQQLKAK